MKYLTVVTLAGLLVAAGVYAQGRSGDAPGRQRPTPPPQQEQEWECCGQEILALQEDLRKRELQLRHQIAQKVAAMQAKQPLEEKVRELEQELAACRAHVLFNEPYEITQ